MPRILLVEDDLDTRGIMRRWLTGATHEVAEAATAERALEMLTSERFDAIVLDVRLPGISGLELARRIRDGRLSSAALVVASVDEDDDGSFVSAWLTKPFDRDALLGAVGRAIEENRNA